MVLVLVLFLVPVLVLGLVPALAGSSRAAREDLNTSSLARPDFPWLTP